MSEYTKKIYPGPMGGTVEKVVSYGGKRKRGKKTRRAKKQTFRLGQGLDKLFKQKTQYKSKVTKEKGSTWLKSPPKYAPVKAGGKRKKHRR